MILNYLRSLCQLNNIQKFLAFFVFLLLLLGCARRTTRPERQESQKSWFAVSERYAYPDFEGNVMSHAFFDFEPRLNLESGDIHFILTTPRDSHFSYQLDLMSGKLLRQHKYCQESDIWERYRSKLNRPPVSLGFIPRMLDQSGQAQEVAVFGGERYFHPFERVPSASQKIRIVGAVIHQYCNEYPCQLRDRWLSRMVLVAVNENDPDFQNVRDLTQLKKEADWSHFKAFMENSYGRNVGLAIESPAYRVTGEFDRERTLKSLGERGLKFSASMGQSMQRSCHALYNYLWFSAQRIRENIAEKKETQLQNMSLSEDDQQELKRIDSFIQGASKPLPAGAQKNFALFLDHFINEYGKSFMTCAQYVRDSNINIEPERHWFFAYIRAYLYLEELGQVYVCNRQTWMDNPLLTNGQRQFDASRERRRCLPSQFDRGFELIPTGMVGRRSGFKEHYRYVEYDSFEGGSHQKIYNWIYDNGKRLSCDKTRPYEIPVFPSDVNWQGFAPTGEDDDFSVIKVLD